MSYSMNVWDVSRLLHEERLATAKNNQLIRELHLGGSPLRAVRKVLNRMMCLFF